MVWHSDDPHDEDDDSIDGVHIVAAESCSFRHAVVRRGILAPRHHYSARHAECLYRELVDAASPLPRRIGAASIAARSRRRWDELFNPAFNLDDR